MYHRQWLHKLILISILLHAHLTLAGMPPPNLKFLAPAFDTTILHTSSIRFQAQIRDLSFPFMHELRLRIFRKNQDGDDKNANNNDGLEHLGTVAKQISPGTDLHSSAQTRQRRKEKAKEIKEMYPALALYSDRVPDLDETDGDLWVSRPETLDFLAGNLENGQYRAICSLHRRKMLSDVGLKLPPLIPTEIQMDFAIELKKIHVQLTDLNGVNILSSTQSTLFSTIPSVLLNFTATVGTNKYRIPEDGSLSITVDGLPHRGPILAYPSGEAVLIGMLQDGLHTIALSPVDSVWGNPIPESTDMTVSIQVIVQAPSRSGGVKIIRPDGIVDDGAVVELEIFILPDENDNDWVVGVDGYVRVQLNNNTEHRTFSHGGPYKVQNVAEGIHHIEVLLVDLHRVPLITSSGIAAVATTKFAFKPDKDEIVRRRKIRGMERQAVDQILTGMPPPDHNSGQPPSTELESMPIGSTATATVESASNSGIDMNAKRRQIALSAIGNALRANEITKEEWTAVKQMIKEDRLKANDDFRELLVDIDNFDAKDAMAFAKNLVLEV